MSTNTRRSENDFENSFQAIAPAEPLSREHIAACAPDADDTGDAETRRLYAVARQNGVASTGPSAVENHDAARVLYLSPDGAHAAELQVPAIADDYSEIPRSITVRPESDRVEQPSDAVVERFGAVLEHHYSVDA